MHREINRQSNVVSIPEAPLFGMDLLGLSQATFERSRQYLVADVSNYRGTSRAYGRHGNVSS